MLFPFLKVSRSWYLLLWLCTKKNHKSTGFLGLVFGFGLFGFFFPAMPINSRESSS